MSAKFFDTNVQKNILEDISYPTEKPCIVVELGHSLTKCGIAGEHAPRWIIPSTAVKTRVGEAPLESIGEPRNVWSYKDKEDLKSMLIDYFHAIYFKYLLVNPKERPVLMVESVLCPTLVRDAIAEVLFNQFEAPSLLFAPGHLLSLLTLGTQTGLVLDCGYKEALVVPVFQGVSVLRAWQAAPLGAEAVHARLRDLLGELGTVEGVALSQTHDWQSLVPESLCEDVKVRACFVTRRARASAYAAAGGDSAGPPPEPQPLDFELTLAGGRILAVPGRLRELACEPLFQPDGDGASVAALLLEALLLCPIDLRAPLAASVLVTGGSAMLPGFNARLREELAALRALPRYQALAGLGEFRFHSPPGKRNFVAWLGGAIVGALEVVSVRAVTRDQYKAAGGRVHDWTEYFYVAHPEEAVVVGAGRAGAERRGL